MFYEKRKEYIMKKLLYVLQLAVISICLLFGGQSNANIWIDENFDDNAAFDSGDLDTYHFEALTSSVVVTHNGALSSAQIFNGTRSYLLSAGDSVSVTPPYSKQGNGAYQYHQFAILAESIPGAGTMAEFRTNWAYDVADATKYSYFVRLVSTGSAINIIAGEDQQGSFSQQIGTLDTSTWKFITVQMQKNIGTENDPVTGQSLSQGMRFYCSSTTPGLAITYPGTAPFDHAKDWKIEVISGGLYIDDVYWEGGLTNEAERKLRPLDKTDVADWNMY
jgi:hypothetical protein